MASRIVRTEPHRTRSGRDDRLLGLEETRIHRQLFSEGHENTVRGSDADDRQNTKRGSSEIESDGEDASSTTKRRRIEISAEVSAESPTTSDASSLSPPSRDDVGAGAVQPYHGPSTDGLSIQQNEEPLSLTLSDIATEEKQIQAQVTDNALTRMQNASRDMLNRVKEKNQIALKLQEEKNQSALKLQEEEHKSVLQSTKDHFQSLLQAKDDELKSAKEQYQRDLESANQKYDLEKQRNEKLSKLFSEIRVISNQADEV